MLHDFYPKARLRTASNDLFINPGQLQSSYFIIDWFELSHEFFRVNFVHLAHNYLNVQIQLRNTLEHIHIGGFQSVLEVNEKEYLTNSGGYFHVLLGEAKP